MVQFCGDVRKKVLLQLFLLLCHPFPVVSIRPAALVPVDPDPRLGDERRL